MDSDPLKLIESIQDNGLFLTACEALDGHLPLEWAGRVAKLAAVNLAVRYSPPIGEAIDPALLDAYALLDMFGEVFIESGYKVKVKAKRTGITRRMIAAALDVEKRVRSGQQQEQAITDVSGKLNIHRSKIMAALRSIRLSREWVDRQQKALADAVVLLND